MKMLLTSFGLSHLQRLEHDNNPDVFYRMPPVSMSQFSQHFLPDYSVLLLADEIILDEKSYDRLVRESHWSYGTMALMLKMLRDEGFIRLEDFGAIVKDNRRLLEQMLEKDLKELDSWVSPLKDSLGIWENFIKDIRGSFREEVVGAVFEGHHVASKTNIPSFQRKFSAVFRGPRVASPTNLSMRGDPTSHLLHVVKTPVQISAMLVHEALLSSEKRRKSEHRQALREHLGQYLSYVNANLLLCEKFQMGFYDWSDFQPFYHEKLLRVAKEAAPAEREIESVKRLFEVSFPEFSFWDPHRVIRALKDKRIRDLRQLVDDSAKGKVDFDREFANRVLLEVFAIERSVAKFRSVVSYITQPLGIIPYAGAVVQKAAEEMVGAFVENRRKQNFRWFYLISELAAKSPK